MSRDMNTDNGEGMAGRPPFLGTRVLDSIALSEVEGFLDREALFASRWQFRAGMDTRSWEEFKAEKVVPVYERLMIQCRSKPIIVPRIVYGYFRCERSGNGLVLHDGSRAFRLDFPREGRTPNRCVADLFGEGFAALQMATVGEGATKAAAESFARHEYSQTFYLKGLAAEFAEACAAYGHAHIRRELGAADGAGERYSPGYPAFPDLSAQKKIVQLLRPERIGVRLTETYQLVPEHSTSALISIDESATRFRP